MKAWYGKSGVDYYGPEPVDAPAETADYRRGYLDGQINRERSRDLLATDALELAIAAKRNYTSDYGTEDATERRAAVSVLLAALPWLAEDIAALKEGK